MTHGYAEFLYSDLTPTAPAAHPPLSNLDRGKTNRKIGQG